MNNPTSAQRAASLDDLELLNELFPGNEEMHNVDNFFENYIAELSNRSKRAGGELPEELGAKQLRLDNNNQHAPIPVSSIINGVAYQPNFSSGTTTGNTAPPYNAAFSPELLQLALQQQQAQTMFAASMGPMMPGSNGMGMMPAIDLDVGDTSALASGHDSGGPVSNSARSNARNKTTRQQESNKLAQQKYRERKKNKFVEMEKQVEKMNQELAALRAVKSRNTILEGMNDELQKAVVDRDRELERLKVEMDTQAEASLGGATSDDYEESMGGGVHRRSNGSGMNLTHSGGDQLDLSTLGGGGAGGGGSPLGYATISCDVLPRDLSGIDFESGFAAQIDNLREFLKKHDLENVTTFTAAALVAPPVLEELAQIVGTSCQLCQAAIRAEGARVLDLITGDPDQLSSAEHPYQERFANALDAMGLTPEQSELMLVLRKAHLKKMREIYSERQTLNMQAMALMLPHHSKKAAENNTLEGKMENISNLGYLTVAKYNVELTAVLDAIKDNLRREQRSSMDLNCATVSRVLTPLQAAHYMLKVYPKHCDALALSNVLAHRLGRAAVAAATAQGSENECGVLNGAGCC